MESLWLKVTPRLAHLSAPHRDAAEPPGAFAPSGTGGAHDLDETL